jgi:hypothetical protein
MGVLYARVGGAWQQIGGGSAADEVYVGSTAPTDPTTELWVDTAANEAAPRGVLGRTVGTATTYSNATTSDTDITVTAGQPPSLTLALPTDRLYRATYTSQWQIDNLTARAIFSVYQAGTIIHQHTVAADIASAGTTLVATCTFLSLTASSVVYKVMARLNATGTVGLPFTAANQPILFMIEDIGSA